MKNSDAPWTIKKTPSGAEIKSGFSERSGRRYSITPLQDGYDTGVLTPLLRKNPEPVTLIGYGPDGNQGSWVFSKINGSVIFGGRWVLYDAHAMFVGKDDNKYGPLCVVCRISNEPGRSYVKAIQQ